MNWRRPERYAFTFIKVGILTLLAAAAFDGTRAAAQDSGGTTEVPPPAPNPGDEVVIREEHVPFTPWTDQPGAIQYESLPVGEQDAIMRQAEWAETRAHEVTTGWSAYAHQAVATAQVQRAAYLSGLNGTEDVGVSP